MRNITAQYRSLLEGKMSKANFMTNVRRTFPDYISVSNSFEDAIKILKNKRILSEDYDTMKDLAQLRADAERSRRNPKIQSIANSAAQMSNTKDEAVSNAIELAKADGITDSDDITNIIDLAVTEFESGDEFADMEKRHEMEKGAEDAKLSQYDIQEAKSSKKHKPDTKEEISEKEVKTKLESKHDGKQLEAALKVFRKIDISKFKTVGETVKEIEANAKKQFPAAFEADEEPKGKKSLKEATEKSEGSYKKVTGKDQYEVFSEIDRVNPYELKKGITMEMGIQYLPTPNYFTDHFNPDTIAKATRKALKNLQEDPAYYSNKISEPTEKRINMHQKPKEMKVGADGGAKVKGFTAAKSNTQTNLGKKEKGSKSPEGVKEMKPSKRSMGGVQVMKSNGKVPKGVQLMEGSIERETQKEIDKILQKSKKKPEEGGYPATKTGVYQGPKKITDPIVSPEVLKKAKEDTEAAKLAKLKEYIVAEVRKALEETMYTASNPDGTKSTYTADTAAAETALKKAMPSAQKVQGSEGVHKVTTSK